MNKSAKYCSYILFINITFISQFSFGQISKMRKCVNEIYFGVPVSSEKFDIKRIFNKSENFYGYEEPDTSKTSYIAVNFEQNPQMSYLGSSNSMLIFFNSNGSFNQMTILSNYLKNEIEKCENQVDQIVAMLKPISFKMKYSNSYNGENKLVGRGYSFYSSLKTFQKNRPYMNISYEEKNDGNYKIDLHYFPSWFY